MHGLATTLPECAHSQSIVIVFRIILHRSFSDLRRIQQFLAARHANTRRAQRPLSIATCRGSADSCRRIEHRLVPALIPLFRRRLLLRSVLPRVPVRGSRKTQRHQPAGTFCKAIGARTARLAICGDYAHDTVRLRARGTSLSTSRIRRRPNRRPAVDMVAGVKAVRMSSAPQPDGPEAGFEQGC